MISILASRLTSQIWSNSQKPPYVSPLFNKVYIEMLEAHSNLGEVMQLLYGQSAFHYYTLEVAKLLA